MVNGAIFRRTDKRSFSKLIQLAVSGTPTRSLLCLSHLSPISTQTRGKRDAPANKLAMVWILDAIFRKNEKLPHFLNAQNDASLSAKGLRARSNMPLSTSWSTKGGSNRVAIPNTPLPNLPTDHSFPCLVTPSLTPRPFQGNQTVGQARLVSPIFPQRCFALDCRLDPLALVKARRTETAQA
ncbi:hypothetical protein BDN72DRAFT_468122 [Pluteus cervinus]|uniref:Uncharacterized protein n=1 Tax=Pluteus cervinus TaxID=181527 RepID=A0ACD3AZQ7_9AGAR|nr:hypothetical protein BDN72DRAFT_468122 [Pluteus cervinus]